MCQHIINLMRASPANFRPPRPAKIACDRHAFSLRPRNDRLPHPHNLTLSFCGPKSASSSKPAVTSRCHCSLNCPVFNQDRSHASPAFILRSEKGHYGQQRETMRVEHELKVRYYSEEKSELNIPKPKSANNYCSVCHTAYEDYLEHTNSTVHTTRLRKSPFNQHILDLALQISQQAQAEQSTSLASSPKLQESTEGVDSEVEVVDAPRKKLKEDFPTASSHSNHAPAGNNIERSHLMGWMAQTPLPIPAEITALLSHQMFLSQYLAASSHFPLISPLYHPAMHPCQLFRLPPPPPYLPPAPPLKPITCIVIDD